MVLLFPILSKQDYNIIIALRGEIYHGGLKNYYLAGLLGIAHSIVKVI